MGIPLRRRATQNPSTSTGSNLSDRQRRVARWRDIWRKLPALVEQQEGAKSLLSLDLAHSPTATRSKNCSTIENNRADDGGLTLDHSPDCRVTAQRRLGMTTFSIGQLAERAGVVIDTVRYYERNQLLVPASRLESGYRRYGNAELKRLRFIRRAKALGFSLADIRGLLSLSDECSVANIKGATETKLADVEQRIAELERIRDGLRALVSACPGQGRAEACPILNALNEENTT